jgi:integrase
MSAATQRRYFAVLSHLFTVCKKEWKWCDDNPVVDVSKPKEPEGRVRFLSEAERANLLGACQESQNPVLLDIVTLAILTGMRRGEILGLCWSEVSFERSEITLPAERVKNGERRTVPLSKQCLEILLERYKDRRANVDLVFPAPAHGNAKPRTYSITTAFENACTRAGIVNFTFHDLRHTYASYIAMRTGANALELAKLMGHKSISMTQRYTHLTGDHLAKTNQAMADAVTMNPAQATEDTAS